MRKTRPQKRYLVNGWQVRLVSKEQYMLRRIKVKAASITSVVAFIGFIGCILSCVMELGFTLYYRDFDLPVLYRILIYTAGIVLFGYTNSGANDAADSDYIDPIAVLNLHTVSQLPNEDTLVRSSDCPATDQQAELLRVAGPGQASPSVELLRAAQRER